MEILMAGDTHGNLGHIMYLLTKACEQDCERVFVLGDFGYWEHDEDGVRFLDAVAEQALEFDRLVYFLDGNHDKTSLLMEKYGDNRDVDGFVVVRDEPGYVLYAPRGHTWEWDNVRFASFGGAYSVDKEWRLSRESRQQLPPGSLWFPEEEMPGPDMVEAAARITVEHGGADVLLTHDKPLRSKPSWNRKDLPECLPNQENLQAVGDLLHPQYWFHGHLHFRYDDVILLRQATAVAPLVPCQVIGLDCDSNSASGYSDEDSWTVFDTDVVI